MDFSFTEEQELLAENLVEFMDREYPESLIKECDEQKIFPVEANKKFYEAGFGAIGVPEEQLREAARSAVCKINIDTDLRRMHL